MHRYLIFEKKPDTEIEMYEIEFDLKDLSTETEKIRRTILEYSKNTKYWVSPMNIESAKLLLKPRKRGSLKVTPQIVLLIHELRANQNYPILEIARTVKEKMNVDISIELVRGILNQERHADVPIPNDLRQKAIEADGIRIKRSVLDKEQKKRIYRRHKKEGISGTQIAKEEGLGSDYVNRLLRKKFGYRKQVL